MGVRRRVLASLFLTFAASCGPVAQQAELQAQSETRFIYEGKDVPSGSEIAQSTVLLVDSRGLLTQGSCTGTLIAPHLVLTAGHCVSTGTHAEGNVTDPSALTVVFGDATLGKGRILPVMMIRTDAAKRSVETIRRHPKYKLTYDDNGRELLNVEGDFALLKINGKLPAGFAPAKILPKSRALESEMRVTLAGFGAQTSTDGIFSGSRTAELMQVDTQVSSQQQNPNLVRLSGTKPGPYGGIVGGACPGDSGGPAWLIEDGKAFAWGVASTADCISTSFYGDFRQQEDWLERTSRELGEAVVLPE